MSQSNMTSEGATAETLAIIREEQGSPTASSVRIIASKRALEESRRHYPMKCTCRKNEEINKTLISPQQLQEILKEKEIELRTCYDKILKNEKELIKDKFNFILSNEQTRASYMLREAHRERQEKITALQSQLQCKNLAALMYVMCTERRRSRLEKLRIIRDYTNYIEYLQEILIDGQQLILNLSRGYKTAARVDNEWRQKMKKVVSEFLAFIYHFAGGSPDTNQYLIDLDKLLKTETPIVDNPQEDPIDVEDEHGEENEEESEDEIPQNLPWWDQMDDEPHPFVMVGDLSEFKPTQRREVIKKLKAKKTAPTKWKEYAFREMFLKSACGNLSKIKDLYADKLPIPVKWECLLGGNGELNSRDRDTLKGNSRQSLAATRAASMDIRANMGSIIKMIASVPNTTPEPAKTKLLGARDSMEITSTTKLVSKLRERASKPEPEQTEVLQTADVLDIGKKRMSVFEVNQEEEEAVEPITPSPPSTPEETHDDENVSLLGSLHNDSLHIMQAHIPEADSKINYERVCPVDKCQRLHVDSFMRSLPAYMTANPYTHFMQTFDEYETCTPEQLEILKQRLESKKKKVELESPEVSIMDSVSEWVGRGVAVQTSTMSFNLPPCTCQLAGPKHSSNFMFDVRDLLPVKQVIDAIHQECFHDEKINFDRFQVVGHDAPLGFETLKEEEPKKSFKEVRYEEIKKILNEHPSLLDIFQASRR